MSRYVLFFAVAASCAACASVLDFQDPTDKLSPSTLPDAGVTARNPASASTSYAAALDASTPDAGDEPVTHGPPALTVDWQGPFVVARTSDGSTPAACDGAYPSEAYLGFSGPVAPDAECSCACGDPADVACSTPTTTFFSDAACTGPCTAATTSLACAAATSYSCDVLKLIKPKAMSVSASVPSGGACVAVPKVSVTAPTWSSAVRLCGGTTAPTVPPGASFSSTNRCVTKPGDNACPASYPAKQVLHQSGTDSRACTECSCGVPANVACIASVSTFNGASCTTAAASLVLPTDCVAVTSSTRITVDKAYAEGGSCSATGGTPTGAFTEDAPTTVCCLE